MGSTRQPPAHDIHPPLELIMLTDGTCGSTCASFVKIPQEHGKIAIRLVHAAFGLEQGERVTIERQLGRV